MEHDKLTGLGTRTSFNATLTRILQAGDTSVSLSLLCINIDNMKKFNMHNGHEKGDELIKQIACLLENSVGSRNALFRTGGDEFMVIMDSCDRPHAVEASQQILASVTDDPLIHQVENCGDQHCMGPADISVSIGIVSTNKTSCNDADVLTEGSRDKMFEAKRSGRNCTKW